MSTASNTGTAHDTRESHIPRTGRRPDASVEKSVEEFIRKNYHDVFRYLYHRVPEPSSAEDLTQDTFLRYLSHVDASELATKGRAYLFTIARNLSIDVYRTQRLATQPITPELEETLADDTVPEDQAADGFEALVAGLPADQREILSLRYAQGFGIGEIAEITGTSRFAVRRKLKRALFVLEKEYEHAE